MKVFVINNNRSETRGPIEAALQAGGHQLVNDVCSLIGVVDKLVTQQPRPEVVVVSADVVQRGREDEMLSLLADWPVVVMVPPSRIGQKDKLEAARQSTATHVRGVLVAPPFDFSKLAEWCAGSEPSDSAAHVVAPPTSVQASAPAPGSPSASTSVQTPAPGSRPSAATAQRVQTSVPNSAPPAGRLQVRLGFYGSRGGAGVSTAALKVAQALAACGQRVALFDTTERGDLHVMLGREPQVDPLAIGPITIHLGQPAEAEVNGDEAVIVDGGRHKGMFNVQWIEVTKPLSDEAIARWAGVKSAAPPRRLNLGSLLSIEVTD